MECSVSDEALKARLEEEVDRAFSQVEQNFKPKLVRVFKGVNYETIKYDEHFRDRIVDHFGEEEANKLLSEYEASRGT
jgi:hypothetical protein